MTDEKRYEGGCHCGKVRFEARMAMGPVIDCNCSICQKRGSLLTFVPSDKFELLAGEGELTQYNFNKHLIDHMFCKTCGILSFARGTRPDGAKMQAINVRCLDGIDLKSLQLREYDGRSK